MKVLVVEDDALQAITYEQAFMYAGIETTLVHVGFAALEQLSRHRFDAVVIDLGLPDISGFDVLHLLRRRYPKLPVVITTGISDPISRRIASAMQVGAYLVKPIVPEVLVHQVLMLIE